MKQLVLGILTVTLFSATAASAECTDSLYRAFSLADYDGDGNIIGETNDGLNILSDFLRQVALHPEKSTPTNATRLYDVDGNGKINIRDLNFVVAVVRELLGDPKAIRGCDVAKLRAFSALDIQKNDSLNYDRMRYLYGVSQLFVRYALRVGVGIVAAPGDYNRDGVLNRKDNAFLLAAWFRRR